MFKKPRCRPVGRCCLLVELSDQVESFVILVGYQMVGHPPVPIFDAAGQLSPFKDHSLLFRVGDCVKFKSISEKNLKLLNMRL